VKLFALTGRGRSGTAAPPIRFSKDRLQKLVGLFVTQTNLYRLNPNEP